MFSCFTQVIAGEGYCLSNIYSSLNTAYNIVNSGSFYTEIQNARPYLKHAEKLMKRQACSRNKTRKISRIIDKAKTEILWNNREEALAHIAHAMNLVENMGNCGCRGNSSYDNGHRAGTVAAGAIIAAPVAIGIGALFAGLFNGFNWGYIRTRVSPPRLPTTIVPVR